MASTLSKFHATGIDNAQFSLNFHGLTKVYDFKALHPVRRLHFKSHPKSCIFIQLALIALFEMLSFFETEEGTNRE